VLNFLRQHCPPCLQHSHSEDSKANATQGVARSIASASRKIIVARNRLTPDELSTKTLRSAVPQFRIRVGGPTSYAGLRQGRYRRWRPARPVRFCRASGTPRRALPDVNRQNGGRGCELRTHHRGERPLRRCTESRKAGARCSSESGLVTACRQHRATVDTRAAAAFGQPGLRSVGGLQYRRNQREAEYHHQRGCKLPSHT
jgi:hypothetical protein